VKQPPAEAASPEEKEALDKKATDAAKEAKVSETVKESQDVSKISVEAAKIDKEAEAKKAEIAAQAAKEA
jgi:hypothetical protein